MQFLMHQLYPSLWFALRFLTGILRLMKTSRRNLLFPCPAEAVHLIHGNHRVIRQGKICNFYMNANPCGNQCKHEIVLLVQLR